MMAKATENSNKIDGWWSKWRRGKQHALSLPKLVISIGGSFHQRRENKTMKTSTFNIDPRRLSV
jgi:hypothetical protein